MNSPPSYRRTTIPNRNRYRRYQWRSPPGRPGPDFGAFFAPLSARHGTDASSFPAF